MTEERDDKLLILVDIGNTNTVFGIYQQDQLVEAFRLASTRERTADEYMALLLPLFQRAELDPSQAEAVVLSSVVPPLEATFNRLAERFFHSEVLFVHPESDTGMAVLYDNPAEVGADRVVNAVAARAEHGAPVVVVDFGTATTFDVVDAQGNYAGGLITPGIQISAEALYARTSRLSRVDIRRPKTLIGPNTVTAIQAGLYYGYVGLVDGILQRLKGEIDGLETVIATGGLASLIESGSEHITAVDQMLTLKGLKLIYERNR